jgi:hypothetical protein
MFQSLILATLLVAPQRTTLDILPWTGNDLPTAVASASAKSRLEVHGTPGKYLKLTTSGVSDGWLAAFCTATVCSPVNVNVKIPESGELVVQFELIREIDNAPASSAASIHSSDGASVRVPAVTR